MQLFQERALLLIISASGLSHPCMNTTSSVASSSKDTVQFCSVVNAEVIFLSPHPKLSPCTMKIYGDTQGSQTQCASLKYFAPNCFCSVLPQPNQIFETEFNSTYLYGSLESSLIWKYMQRTLQLNIIYNCEKKNPELTPNVNQYCNKYIYIHIFHWNMQWDEVMGNLWLRAVRSLLDESHGRNTKWETTYI